MNNLDNAVELCFFIHSNFVKVHTAQLITDIKHTNQKHYTISIQGDYFETDIPAKHIKTQKNSWFS